MCPIKDFLTFADRNGGFSDEVIGKQNDDITFKTNMRQSRIFSLSQTGTMDFLMKLFENRMII